MIEWRSSVSCPYKGCLTGFKLIGPEREEMTARLAEMLTGHIAADHVDLWRLIQRPTVDVTVIHDKAGDAP